MQQAEEHIMSNWHESSLTILCDWILINSTGKTVKLRSSGPKAIMKLGFCHYSGTPNLIKSTKIKHLALKSFKISLEQS